MLSTDVYMPRGIPATLAATFEVSSDLNFISIRVYKS
jgi:hypothetical protein